MGTIRVCVGVCLLVMLASTATAQYWHGVDALVPLTIDSSRVSVKPDGGFSTQELEEAVDPLFRVTGVPEEETPPGFVVLSLAVAPGYAQFLDTLQALPGVDLVEPFYLDESGRPALIGDRFIASFDEFVSVWEIDSINEAFGVEIDHQIGGIPPTPAWLGTISHPAATRSTDMAAWMLTGPFCLCRTVTPTTTAA